MNTPDPIEEALQWIEGLGRSYDYTGTKSTILAAEVRRLRKVVKDHDEELRDAVRQAISEERSEARDREREL